VIRSNRLRLVHGALLLFAIALVVRAGLVQLWQGPLWAARAQRQHVAARATPAPRGAILDERGEALVVGQERVRLSVAPREVADRAALARSLRRAGVAPEWVARATDTGRAWVGIPGRYLPSDAAAVTTLRGVYAEPVADRLTMTSGGIVGVVGHVAADGTPLDGIELSLDTVLRGGAGRAAIVRDGSGRRFESPALPGVSATPGNTVVLTINRALQEICERALADAMARLGAQGGDIVVLDPRNGEIRAMASSRAGQREATSSAVTEPFEPGSTLKPFVAAALLGLGRARPSDVVATHHGRFSLNGRIIEDTHVSERMSLSEVIQFSSNIGIVQFAQRLTPREEFEALRDVGFGAPTGVPLPSEAAGTLREPRRWSAQTPASIAMGYEIAVTPLQLATAYGAIANGGELLEPGLVREIRAPDGEVLYRREPRVLRRIMTPEVARTIRGMLAKTVASGTAVQADLANFEVGGKTGTARRTVRGRYAQGQYTASFIGLFPADEPQYVILVKLDNPAGAFAGMRASNAYFGGRTAAPISRTILEAAIAARDVALDRGQLASRERTGADTEVGGTRRVVSAGTLTSPASPAAPGGAPDSAGSPLVVIALDKPLPAPVRPAAARVIPDVSGMPLRNAVLTLHRAGFKVQLAGGGGSAGRGGTVPARGTLARPGAVVRLYRGAAK
jgi:cell division protein FtsI (penicillin-binding protein 3)